MDHFVKMESLSDYFVKAYILELALPLFQDGCFWKISHIFSSFTLQAIFLTTLFYLLASSGKQFKPLEWISGLNPHPSGSTFSLAVEEAIGYKSLSLSLSAEKQNRSEKKMIISSEPSQKNLEIYGGMAQKNLKIYGGRQIFLFQNLIKGYNFVFPS